MVCFLTVISCDDETRTSTITNNSFFMANENSKEAVYCSHSEHFLGLNVEVNIGLHNSFINVTSVSDTSKIKKNGTLNAHVGDAISLYYFPEQEYKAYSYNVIYKINNEDIIPNSNNNYSAKYIVSSDMRSGHVKCIVKGEKKIDNTVYIIDETDSLYLSIE